MVIGCQWMEVATDLSVMTGMIAQPRETMKPDKKITR